MDAGDGSAEAWLATFTRQIRTQLPQGQFILTHARKYTSAILRVSVTYAMVLVAVAPWYANMPTYYKGSAADRLQVLRQRPLCGRRILNG